MTLRCKSFKSRASELDEHINKYLASNPQISEIVHVATSSSPGSTLSYLTIFFREIDLSIKEDKTKLTRGRKPKIEKNLEENKEQNNG